MVWLRAVHWVRTFSGVCLLHRNIATGDFPLRCVHHHTETPGAVGRRVVQQRQDVKYEFLCGDHMSSTCTAPLFYPDIFTFFLLFIFLFLCRLCLKCHQHNQLLAMNPAEDLLFLWLIQTFFTVLLEAGSEEVWRLSLGHLCSHKQPLRKMSGDSPSSMHVWKHL